MQLTKEDIYTEMLATRGRKYRTFIRCLKAYKFVTLNFKKGDLLESYYVLMRYTDDVVDGDVELPEGYGSRSEFVQKRLSFLESDKNPVESVDQLLDYCLKLAAELRMDIIKETEDILQSMLFDAERIGKNKVFLQGELDSHFFLLDTRGTVRLSLKIFNDDPDTYIALSPLSLATRIYYNLRDFDEDISAGLINIGMEDFEKYGMTMEALADRNSPAIRGWFLNQARKGVDLLDEHKKAINNHKFKLLGRLTLPLIYEKPARKFFEKILAEQSNNR